MRILLTNSFMAACTGSEMAVFDMARALGARGHQVAIHAPVLSGRWYKRLHDSGLEAVDDPDRLSFRPQIIHGQHVVAFAACMQAFPECSVVQWIHDLTDPVDTPLRHPSVAAFVAVDGARAQRARAAGADADSVHVVPNAVDLQRFLLQPLNGQRRALCIVKRAGLDGMMSIVQQACEASGWIPAFRGAGVGDEIEDLEKELLRHDLVITSGRCALEAIAMGRNVVLCDYGQFGGVVDALQWQRQRDSNFGLNAMSGVLAEADLAATLAGIDPQAGHQFAATVRASLDLKTAAAQVEAIYTNIIRLHAPLSSLAERAAMTADVVREVRLSSATHLDHWRRVAVARS